MAEEGQGGPSATDVATAVKYGIGITTVIGGTGSAASLPFGVAGVIVICGFGVLLAPLIALYLLFHGGGGDTPSQSDQDEVYAVSQGDGKGELDTSTIPDDDLVDTVQDAGEECDAIGPVVIAAQIAAASAWNASMVGEHGEEGISGLKPDIFSKYGKDTDKNNKTSAFDAKDSIMAQARYMCALVDDAQKVFDDSDLKVTDEKTEESYVLDLTLAAYSVGIDAVREAKGIPEDGEAQGYVAEVRARFAMYEGYGDVPNDYGTGTSTPSQFITPSNSPSGSADTDTATPTDTSSPSPTDTGGDDDTDIALPGPGDTTRPTA